MHTTIFVTRPELPKYFGLSPNRCESILKGLGIMPCNPMARARIWTLADVTKALDMIRNNGQGLQPQAVATYGVNKYNNQPVQVAPQTWQKRSYNKRKTEGKTMLGGGIYIADQDKAFLTAQAKKRGYPSIIAMLFDKGTRALVAECAGEGQTCTIVTMANGHDCESDTNAACS